MGVELLGRLVSIAEMTQPSAEHRYEYRYDEGSRLVAELQTFAGSWTGGNQNIGFERDYDAYDNLTETRAFRGASFSVGGQSIDTTTSSDDYVDTRLYDAQNRLESITRGADTADGVAALHVAFGYDNAGRQSRVNRYHGSDDSAGVSWNTVLDYDQAGRLTTITHSDPLDSVNPLSVYERVFSQAGAIESTTVTLGTTEHLTKTYSQDNRGQVISESYFSGSSPSSQHTTRSYGPDAAGNRALEVIQSQTHHHTIERDNRLVSDSRWSYTHDDEGNVTSKTSADGKSLWQYAWDHRNRLIEATLRYDASGNVSAASSITRTVSQTYDGLDRWIGSENSETGEKRLHVYDSGQLTLEFVDGTVENRYLWADGVDQLLAEDGAAANEEPRWTLTDHLGSVRDIVSETTSLSHTDYDAFGNVEGTAADLLFGYTARPYDESTDLQNNHHRWYSAEIGRWLSQDPIGFAAGDANLYRYVGNQVTTLVDPDGLEPPVGDSPGWATAKQLAGFWWENYSFGTLASPINRVRHHPTGILANGLPGKAYDVFDEAKTVSEREGTSFACELYVSSHTLVIRPAEEIWDGRDRQTGESLSDLEYAQRGAHIVTSVTGGVLTARNIRPDPGLANPFRKMSASQLDKWFRSRGFRTSGPNPVSGKGGYVDPCSGRSYHIDPANSYGEPAHVDVNRPRIYRGPIPKKKFPFGE